MSFLQDVVQKLTDFASNLNQKGIPIPLLRDNATGRGSYTLTMFWVAFNISILALIGKATNFLGGVDYNNVLWLLGLCGSFYLGRGIRKDGSKIELDAGNKE